MQKFHYAFLTAVLVCALCASGLGISAQDKEPAPDGARDFSPEEIKAADDLRLTLSTERQTLFNGLRYLLRPEFEPELMKGRRYQPCPLPPYEEKTETALDLLGTLRFWAVLQSGITTTASSDRQLQRLLELPAPDAKSVKSTDNLAPIAVQVLTLRAAMLRTELGRADEIKKKAETLINLANEATGATSDRSSLISGQFVAPGWFANQMWRSLLGRAALDFGLKLDDRQWEKDLRSLSNVYVKDQGWTSNKRAVNSTTNDLHTNYMALVALWMAAAAPEGTINDTTTRAIDKRLKTVPELLARLDTEYATESMSGSRLLLLNSLPEDYAPERQTPTAWRENLARRGIALLEPAGWVMARHSMAADIGLTESKWNRSQSTVCETALTCIALSGGLLATEQGPLAEYELASVGRIMYALAVLHASKARTGGADFESRVNFAIEDGAKFLAEIQNPDGSFPGTYSGYPGNTAYCLLAMMHGGVSRDADGVKKGLDWMMDEANKAYQSTYDAAAILMCLQKYYEPEQRKAGILYVSNEKEFEDARREVWGSISKQHATYIKTLIADLNDAQLAGNRGGWGYGGIRAQGGGQYSDNSCSQYAVLGYKAASLLGADLNTKVFEDEAERLIRQYWEDPNAEPVEYVHSNDDREGDDNERKNRKTAAEFKSRIRPGGWSYLCGTVNGASMQLTAAGISSLTICMDELKVRGKLKEKLAQKIGLTVRGAEAKLHATYYSAEVMQGNRNPFSVSTSDGWGVYYNLYSVERGCVLAGIRKLNGETDWYEIGANALIEHQNMDGSWGSQPQQGGNNRRDRQQLINTCLAILFLKRAAMPVITEHKKREREAEEKKKKDQPRNPVTGEPKDKKEAPEGSSGE